MRRLSGSCTCFVASSERRSACATIRQWTASDIRWRMERRDQTSSRRPWTCRRSRWLTTRASSAATHDRAELTTADRRSCVAKPPRVYGEPGSAITACRDLAIPLAQFSPPHAHQTWCAYAVCENTRRATDAVDRAHHRRRCPCVDAASGVSATRFGRRRLEQIHRLGDAGALRDLAPCRMGVDATGASGRMSTARSTPRKHGGDGSWPARR